jgi:hypothetical protein
MPASSTVVCNENKNSGDCTDTKHLLIDNVMSLIAIEPPTPMVI